MTNNNILKLKSIYELLTENFYIPSYQRGYRWTESQVKALLNDIWDFRNSNPKTDEFYCLQPIVVTKTENIDGNPWELIDGQQRLTTIYIILSYFNKRLAEDSKGPIFSLEYATRGNSKSFLLDIKKEDKDENIDYYFIYEAFETIKTWFSDKINFIGNFESVLLNNTKVIWYEVDDESTNTIDIFTRINDGKIPLTNAELVKALFLQKDNFETKHDLKQLQIASEWDQIEKKLQNNSFWYFIYSSKNEIKYENRIEYIFDLMYDKKKDNEDYFTFNKFQNSFKESITNNKGKLNIDSLWLNVKKYFLTLEEWYNNRDLYHLIGFLIEYNTDINTLKKTSDTQTKLLFKKYLKDLIKLKLANIQLEELDYGSSNKEIKMVLLLFNIQTIISTVEADMRFPFDKYKSQNWDIEHINSQADRTINPVDRKSWALDLVEFYTGINGYSDMLLNTLTLKEIQLEKIETLLTEKKDICKKLIKILDADKVSDELFQSVYDDIINLHSVKDFLENDNISNLALLDEETNRGYGNAMFFIKRKKIIENDKQGIFVPICTKNVFLKYYTKHSDNNLNWTQNDANDYLETMKEVLRNYLTKKV
ncbi:DUF262 domain-containing protein [Flavobacterium sp. XS2P24]|uniref:DUF262 domain-containing protein n=1 Tax=Flavobacterium sp. XS2P24 TaxID=3041249 RepID=UPI0024A8F252|nr:DUF262 domain-containing protein [Flavobacterium sp. XS2P24]MDI6051192.1 DUF262 domain-containing protein [Flavobacterium sp. XS2P24]